MREPQFVADLHRRLHSEDQAELLPPLPKKFLRKRVPNYFKRGAFRSAIFHGLLVIAIPLTVFISRWTGMSAEEEARLKALQIAKTAIRVDMVDLPTLKLSEMQNVDLSKEVDDSAEAELPAENKPSPTAMIDRSKEDAKKLEKAEDKKAAAKKEAEKLAEKKQESERRKDAEKRVKDLQARLRGDQKRRDLIDKLKKKSGDGRVALGGNQKSEGYALTGDIATAADAYQGRARAHVQKNWNVPGWMNASNLAASILVHIGPDGRVLSKKFTKRSGNAEFDSYVEKAIELSDPLPAPPDGLKHTYMEDGIEWGFPN